MNPDRKGEGVGGGWPEAPGGEQAWLTTWLMLLPDIKAIYINTDKKENQIFLIYKEMLSGAVAKSYMRKGFQIYEEMRKYFPIYEEAVSHI
jgi:hypothetical protein